MMVVGMGCCVVRRPVQLKDVGLLCAVQSHFYGSVLSGSKLLTISGNTAIDQVCSLVYLLSACVTDTFTAPQDVTCLLNRDEI